MKYSKVYIGAMGYELAPVVVSSRDLEARLAPVYDKLHMPMGQLQALTGIEERRWWEPGFAISDGAAAAARQALSAGSVTPKDLDILIYAGVCREQFEPATACRVAALLGVGGEAAVFDVSNACLGVLNGIVDVANRIELGQIRAGLIVSCESAREINEIMISKMLAEPTHDVYRSSIATLTGGSGAVAVLLTDGSFSTARQPRLVGGVNKAEPQFHALCRWGIEALEKTVPAIMAQSMVTDSIAVLKYGVDLGLRTWRTFLTKLGWACDQIDKVICHQVGGPHRDSVLATLGIGRDRDFSTFPFLGNMGTVSLPLTAALAEEREFLRRGDRVGLLGIGSGLNCLMLGVEW